MQGQELNLIIPMGAFQLSIFYDYTNIKKYTLPWPHTDRKENIRGKYPMLGHHHISKRM